MGFTEGVHADLMREAIAVEAGGQRALLSGDAEAAVPALRQAADLYRASWEAAPPASYGRLIGVLKASILAGDARAAADYATGQIPDDATSPPASYARAITALVDDDDATARTAAEHMRAGSPAFVRAADAITALVDRDDESYTNAIAAIADDFAARDEHLTGVAIADTALMLERLAAPRGMASSVTSPLLPAAGT
ncbi:MAG TPA: hypothetical protein VK501_14630 [Baekduia sp.]|uniref:hypothetical protein n=1 Tax=Baekduia sp. TaxID=2600305 RepID=UPI002C92C278|nr:hypothetical protein [Baekduia sp.]HMJ35144.1 hypothetical protein [Baekduia sp.]